MKRTFRLLAVAAALLCLFCLPAAAQGTGKSYVYSNSDLNVSPTQEIPDPYEVTRIVGPELHMASPVDMTVRGDTLYILDTGHAESEGFVTRILVLDRQYRFERQLVLTDSEGGQIAFVEPKGLWVDEAGTIYVVDRGGHRIYLFSPQGSLIRALGKPDSPMITYEEDKYLPTRVLTDNLGVIYIAVEGDYRGFLTVSPEGEFLGYFGSNEVTRTGDVIFLNLWKRFLTEEQLARIQKVLPMGYSNFCIDADGAFIYGVRGTTEDNNELIRKLNCKSKNVLDYTGYFGDATWGSINGQRRLTNFNAITVDNEGFITTFDSTWQRLFQYTPDGYQMYIFGGQGNQVGTFTSGVDLESWGNQLLVLDSAFATVTVMEPTEFGANVRLGEKYYNEGNYTASKEPYRKVISQCMNYQSGYQGIGKAQYMEHDYKAAMDSFYLAYDQDGYSMAFKMYRGEVMRGLTAPFLIVIVVLVAAWAVLKVLRAKGIVKKRRLVLDESGKVKYMFHTLLHPIDGYSEMRYNKKYSLTIANVAVFFFFFSSVIMSLYSGFIFNGRSAASYNMLMTVCTVLGGLALFVLVNWLMSSFFEGKGKLKEVWIYVAYATIPYSVTCLLYTLLSNILTAEESTFLTYLMIIGQGWALVMLFFALQEVHMYSAKRNLVSILVTVLGMAAVLFILFLMFNLFLQFASFIESIFDELMYRSAVGF